MGLGMFVSGLGCGQFVVEKVHVIVFLGWAVDVISSV